MPTIFTHPAVPLGLAPWFRKIPGTLVLLGVVSSSVPDVDVVSFALGIPYEHPLGHRGFMHSLIFAAAFASLVALAYARFARSTVAFRDAFLFLFVAVASHCFLDAMTNGGKGVGFFIPFSSRRFFLPFRPIEVSPIGVKGFATEAAAVLTSELRWVWLPFAVVAVIGLIIRLAGTRPD